MGKLARINAKRRAVTTMERFDNFAGLRHGLSRMAKDRGDWAGIPMPLEGQPLVIEPRYPKAKELMSIGREQEKADDQRQIRNRFWSDRLRSTIYIWTEANGRIEWGITPGANHVDYDLMTLGASDVWGIEQEHNALQLLGTLLPHRTLKQYLLTGMFLETSRRSGVTYMFRRLKPTIAIRSHGEKMRVLCAMCLHPIAYYEGSWAGAMTPTDDVIAHLQLMRGDEVMFWRRANQHHAARPEAGL